MDLLSEVLKAVRLRGALFFNAEASAPWCLNEPGSTQIAPHLKIGSGRLILYHFVLEGRAFARTRDGRREDLEAGDVVVVPHGEPHVLGNGWPEKPVDAIKAFAGNLKEGLKAVRFGGGGETTKLVCGYIILDSKLGEVLLSGLPPLLKVRVTDELSRQWLKNSIQYSVGDGGGADGGRDLVISKLSEVLFIETLRRYIVGLPEDDRSWLSGTRDPFVGKTLALMHAHPEQDWTVEELARQVGTSRTRLAERFNEFLGSTPMAYLMRWRLKLGADLLLSTSDSVAVIAAAVGYGSEATFNRAFRREYGSPPAHFRRASRSS